MNIDGDSFKKLFAFNYKYSFYKKIEITSITCSNNEELKNELVIHIKKDEINHLLIYSFEIENNEFNYKEIKLIKVDYLFISIKKN